MKVASVAIPDVHERCLSDAPVGATVEIYTEPSSPNIFGITMGPDGEAVIVHLLDIAQRMGFSGKRTCRVLPPGTVIRLRVE